MPMSPVVPRFELSEEHPPSGAHVIDVHGEIHLSTAPDFSERLTAAIDRGSMAIVIDLSGVEFIDSTGLSVLLNGMRLVAARKGSLALVCANPTVLRLFQITGLDHTFAIHEERGSACEQVLQEAAGSSSDGAP